MGGVRADRTLVDPAGHFDQRAQADDGLVPPQLAEGDSCRRLTSVGMYETAGHYPPHHLDDRPLPARPDRRRVWEPISATGRTGELPDLLRRGRPLLLQGTASTLADRLGAALADRADTAGDDGRLRAALDEIRVGAVADADGTIHRRGDM
jgi:hypothetical protein